MNLCSAAIVALRGFAARHRATRGVKQRTYVFSFVPLDFSHNGHAKKAEIAQGLINRHSDFDAAANYTPRALLTLGRGEIGCATETTPDAGVESEPQLDSRLMWTWFLPNPPWKPKQRR